MVEAPTRTTAQHFTVPARAPFRLDFTAWALRRRPENHIDDWDGQAYRRVVVVDDVPVALAVEQYDTATKPALSVTSTPARPVPSSRSRPAVIALLRRVLGVDTDTAAFRARVRSDRAIGPLVVRFRGVKPPRFPTMFECLVNAIACQQLTLQVGILLLDRLAAAYGRRVPGADARYAFPDPVDLSVAQPADLTTLGFSAAKARAILALAAAIRAGDLDLEALDACDDATATTLLTALRGVGRWTAEYALLRGLGRVRIFPGDDVGARNNLARRLGIDGPLDYAGVRRVTRPWDPYAGFVYFHLLLERIEANGWLRPSIRQRGGPRARRSG